MVDNQDGVSIQDCYIENFVKGIEIINSAQCEIIDNNLGNSFGGHNVTAIELLNTDDCIIRDNSVRYNVRSILLNNSDDNVINDNWLAETEQNCLELVSSDNNDIMKNNIVNCGDQSFACGSEVGLCFVGSDGIHLDNSSDNNIIIRNDSDSNADDDYEINGNGNKVRKNDADSNGSIGFNIGNPSTTQCKKNTGGGNPTFSNTSCN